jgi:hypothetical protein
MVHEVKHSEEASGRRDHATWLDDVRRWRSEHHRALVDLTKVFMTILVQDEELESYALRIEAHEEHLQEYELAPCESAFDGFGELGNRHREFAAIHEQLRREHERAKTRHDNALAEIRKLLKGVLVVT